MNHGPVVSAHAIDRYLERIQWLPSRKHAADKIKTAYFDGFKAPWTQANQRWNSKCRNFRSHTESGTNYYLTPTMVVIVNKGLVRTILTATTGDVATALTYLLTGHWIGDCEEDVGMVVVDAA
jgi:hypothetical protein